MSQNNVSLFPGCVVPPNIGEAVPEIVALLETALREAKEGTLKGIAIAKVVYDGTDAPIMTDTWHIACRQTNMVFAVNRLVHRMNLEAFS